MRNFVGPDQANQFVAMEYYWLIFNRIMFVTVTSNDILGIRVNGAIIAPKVARPEMTDPYFYINQRLLKKYEGMNDGTDRWLSVDKANFRVLRHQIVRVDYHRSKWGMGSVPYSGRLVISLTDGKARELILVGHQDVQKIQTMLWNSQAYDRIDRSRIYGN